MNNIPCGRPAKKLCQNGPECWCKESQTQGATVLHVWDAVCDEAEAIVIRGEKFLLLDEEMTFRIREAIQKEILAGIKNAAPAAPEGDRWS